MVKETTDIFNWVDYIILVIIGLSTVVGVFRGFIKEAISLLVWVAAIFVAIKLFPPLGQYIHKHGINSIIVSNIIAFVGLFLITLLIGLIINIVISLLIEKTGLNATDRLLGIVFGLVRGVLLVAILLMFVTLSSLHQADSIKQSKLASTFLPISDWLSKFVPKGLDYAMNAIEPSSSKDSSKMTQDEDEESSVDENLS
jgi:membrane protein required for colicin V production